MADCLGNGNCSDHGRNKCDHASKVRKWFQTLRGSFLIIWRGLQGFPTYLVHEILETLSQSDLRLARICFFARLSIYPTLSPNQTEH
jgi:hypothetical protein